MPLLSLLAALVDFGGTLIVIAVAFTCLRDFLRTGGAPAALDPLRLRLAEGLALALSFKQFGTLLFLIALRFFLGHVLKAQAARRTG